MSLATSSISPLIAQTPLNPNFPEYVTIINPDGSVTYEPNLHYQQPTIIRRSYAKPRKARHRYALEQEGKAYRCCEWCRHCWTRNCRTLDFCDRILACPLLFYLISALLLLALLIALLTLFGLDPNINSSTRFYGIIKKLSISNRTTYIYGLDTICNKYSATTNCLNLTTSTSVSIVATTIVLSRTISIHNYSYVSFILLCSCLVIYCIHRRINSSTI